jgi:hypothetical protein
VAGRIESVPSAPAVHRRGGRGDGGAHFGRTLAAERFDRKNIDGGDGVQLGAVLGAGAGDDDLVLLIGGKGGLNGDQRQAHSGQQRVTNASHDVFLNLDCEW